MIDWDRVTQLKQEIGEDDFGEIVDLFLEEVDEVIDRLRHWTGGDLAVEMHFLKGSALSIGCKRFANMCAAGERQAMAGGPPNPAITDIIACYDASRLTFLASMDDPLVRAG